MAVNKPYAPIIEIHGHTRYELSTDYRILAAPGDYEYVTADEAISQFDVCYGTTAGKWAPADADATSTATSKLGMALESAASDGDKFIILYKGRVYRTTFNFANEYLPVYVSTTAGAMTTTAPSGSGDVVRIIGHVTSSLDAIDFEPCHYWTVVP